jgi:hypothetical protein
MVNSLSLRINDRLVSKISRSKANSDQFPANNNLCARQLGLVAFSGSALGSLSRRTMMNASMPAPLAPRRLVRTGGNLPPARPPQGVSFSPIPDGAGHRIVLYGPGGVGKTTLAAIAPGPLAIFDLEDSLPVLKAQLPADVQRQIRRVGGITSWQGIRDALNAPGWDSIRTIIIDSATRAEELAVAHTLKFVPHEKGEIPIRRIEDYGFGKGYTHVYETFLPLLADLDAHARAGRHVILICHDCTNTVPNPGGEDWLRYEPRLQSPPSGKASIRLRVREWADHVLFVGYDLNVKDGKGSGYGSRTLYPFELPHCMAKSRTLKETLTLNLFDDSLWTTLLGDQHDSQS